MAAALPVLPYISAGLSVVKAVNQDATGRFNQAIQNRNAQIAEQEKQAIADKTEFDLQQFDKQFSQLQGQATTRILTSGAELSGSGLRVLHSNEVEKTVQENVMKYNSLVAQNTKSNEATMSRIQGQYMRDQGRSSAIGTLISGAGTFMQSGAGKSLLDSVPNPFSSYSPFK
jgi:hypothetical protein